MGIVEITHDGKRAYWKVNEGPLNVLRVLSQAIRRNPGENLL